MPLAATTREGTLLRALVAEGLLLPRPHAGSLAHAVHTLSPSLGRVLLLDIASVTVRSPAIRDDSTRRWFESTDAFITPLVMPGTDDPSMPGSSTDLAVDGS
jgi:hypothetical protein